MRRRFGFSASTLALMAGVAIAGTSPASRRRASTVTQPLTPAQIAERERNEWNAAVDRRKAEKKSRQAVAPSAAAVQPDAQEGQS